MHGLLSAARGVLIALAAILAFGDLAHAQGDVDVTYWAYFSDDASIVLTLGELTSSDPNLAAELVSPQYADQFFTGFTLFTNYDYATLNPMQTAQVSGADEYMVFVGTLDGVDGPLPGLLMFLSTNQQVFVIHGYARDANFLFDLAEQTILDGRSPQNFLDFTRINTTELSDEDPVEASNSSSNTGGYSDEVGRTFCANDPMFEPFDLNGDNYVTQYEFSLVSGLSGDVDDLLQTMVDNDFDSIQVLGCTPS